jgi:MerR family transcriptional regulator, heat shock protein HspR
VATPPPRAWRDRVSDPDEPLYTIAVAADLLGIDTQTVRRLEGAAARVSARPSGNQRRYSLRDIEVLDVAVRLAGEGYPPQAISRLLELEVRLSELSDPTVF